MIGAPRKLRIRREFVRVPAATVAAFAERSSSFIADAQEGRGALDWRIKGLDPASRFCGTAVTAYAGARDILAVLAALDILQPGDVLVISTQMFTGTACLGDNVVKIAKGKGAVGIVTDGVVRDIDDILEIGLPVFCQGATPATGFASGPGEIGLPVAMGEVTVCPGDLIAGDRDGIVVVARDRADAVSTRLAEIAELEATLHADIVDGRKSSLLDLFSLGADEIEELD